MDDLKLANFKPTRKIRDGDLETTMWTNSSLSMAERKEKQLEWSTSLCLAMNNHVPIDELLNPNIPKPC
jgi:hypothetical protein